MPFVKVFSAKIGVAHFGLLRIISGLWWIHESFLHEILYFNDSWKFSPSKVSRYTVYASGDRSYIAKQTKEEYIPSPQPIFHSLLEKSGLLTWFI